MGSVIYSIFLDSGNISGQSDDQILILPRTSPTIISGSAMIIINLFECWHLSKYPAPFSEVKESYNRVTTYGKLDRNDSFLAVWIFDKGWIFVPLKVILIDQSLNSKFTPNFDKDG